MEAGMWEIAGYAAIWNTRKHAEGYVWAPRAFEAAMLEHQLFGTTPEMLWNHIPDGVIGRWLEVFEDDRGLYVSGLVNAREGRALMKARAAGVGPGLSIGPCEAHNGKPGEADGEVVFGCVFRLPEISIVGRAADRAAVITYFGPQRHLIGRKVS